MPPFFRPFVGAYFSFDSQVNPGQPEETVGFKPMKLKVGRVPVIFKSQSPVFQTVLRETSPIGVGCVPAHKLVPLHAKAR